MARDSDLEEDSSRLREVSLWGMVSVKALAYAYYIYTLSSCSIDHIGNRNHCEERRRRTAALCSDLDSSWEIQRAKTRPYHPDRGSRVSIDIRA